MDHASLVKDKIEEGRDLLRNLDADGHAPKAALWLYDPEQEDWKLVLSGESYEGENYKKSFFVIDANLRKIKSHQIHLTDIQLLKLSDPLIQRLRRMTRVENSTVRLSKSNIDGIYIDDALIYRLQP